MLSVVMCRNHRSSWVLFVRMHATFEAEFCFGVSECGCFVRQTV